MKTKRLAIGMILTLLIGCATSQTPKPDILSMSDQELLTYAQNLQKQAIDINRSHEDVTSGVYNSISLPVASMAERSLRHKYYNIEDEMRRVSAEMNRRMEKKPGSNR
jgi:hypothetical protein